MSEHTVIGVDGSASASASASAAVEWSSSFARQTDARITAVFAFSPWVEGEWMLSPHDIREFQERIETKLRDQWCDPFLRAGVDFECRIVQERPADALLKEREEATAALLVLGRHGRNAWAPHTLGGVARQVLSKADCPIVLVPERPDPEEVGSSIVAGIDGSAPSLRAFDWAVGHASALDRSVEAVWVDDSLRYVELPWLTTSEDEHVLDEAEAELRRLVEKRAPSSVSVTHRVVVGHPGGVLVELSAGAAILVIGSRGRTSIVEHLLGCVSLYCAAHAECPVVVVP